MLTGNECLAVSYQLHQTSTSIKCSRTYSIQPGFRKLTQKIQLAFTPQFEFKKFEVSFLLALQHLYSVRFEGW
jgi:hypothetical protein